MQISLVQKLAGVLQNSCSEKLKFLVKFFSKVKVGNPATLLKKDSGIVVFEWNIQCFYIWNLVARCAIWNHLNNLKNVKNTRGGVLLLVKLHADACNFTKSNPPPWVFLRFLNCAHGTKSCNAPRIFLGHLIQMIGRQLSHFRWRPFLRQNKMISTN